MAADNVLAHDDDGGAFLIPRRNLLTAIEVAEAYGCHRNLVQSMMRNGAIPTVKVGARRMVLRRELEVLLAQVDRLKLTGTVLPIARLRTNRRRSTPAA